MQAGRTLTRSAIESECFAGSVRYRAFWNARARFRFGLVFLACWLLSSSPARAADELRPEAVLKSIESAKRFLISQQGPDGTFPSMFNALGMYPTGGTSLATLALLNIGMTPQDPPIQKALAFLREQKSPNKTYEAGLQLMVYAAAKDGNKDRARMAGIVRTLEEAQQQADNSRGWWSYTLAPNSNGSDHSNTQYAVMGLREAAFAGIPTSRKGWELTREHWTNAQGGDGGWTYGFNGGGSTGSMSVAGIASLVMADSMLPDDDDVNVEGLPDCCREEKPNVPLERGLKWLEGHFAVGHNVGDNGIGGSLYYLYGLERAGRLSGKRFIGNHDWFREGARFLVTQQVPDGRWATQGHGDGDPIVGTSFGLLFLSKGMAPVLINKLHFGPRPAPNPKGFVTEDWNRHRRDVHNLTDLISGMPKWPKLVTWQIVEMDKAVKGGGVADLLQAPVLFLSGRDKPALQDKEVDLLREYVNAGGFLFATCNCNGAGFDEGFREMIPRMYPNGEAELKKLPPDHPIFRSEHLLDTADVNLWGVDFGCRTAIVYSPDDIACGWNKWCVSDPPNRKAGLKSYISKSTRIGVNVVAYATGREPPDKLKQAEFAKQASERERIEAGLLEIVQLKHTGGWDTAPKALHNLLIALNQAGGLAASTKPKALAPSDPNLFNYAMAYMHGRHKFEFTRPDRERLKQYLDNGGVLFADACCSEKAFDKSFRELMAQIFPDKPLARIPVTHEVFTNRNGHELKTVRRRGGEEGSGKGVIAGNVVTGEPQLEGIELDGRLAVIYSKYDISCALERQTAVACEGYVSDDATKLAINTVLYFLSQELR